MIGPIDISYEQESNFAFISIVIGIDENIEHMYKRLGSKKIHMSTLCIIQQDESLSKIEFDDKNNIAFCVKINKNMKKITNTRKIKQKSIPTGKIYQLQHGQLLYSIQERIEKFPLTHNYELDDIFFRCDSDSKGFVRDVSCTFDPKNIHEIVDTVAWLNKQGRYIKNLLG